MEKTILFIITKSETGGAQKFVSEQMNCLARTNRWQFLLATNSQGWLTKTVENLVQDEGLFLDSRIENKFSISYLLGLIQFILKKKPDLVVSNSANGGFYGRIASFVTKTKIIYVSHGWSSIYNGGKLKFVFNYIEKLLSYLTTSILCISEKDKIKAIQILKISPSKLKVIPNSILPITPYFHKPLADIVTVCRLASPKRIDILIEAMALIPQFKLHIIGDGPLRLTLEKIIKDKKLQNVEFCGYRPNFQEFYQYKIFCLISDSEGMPMSAIEAMSCGLPLILSNIGGCSEVIENNGLLVDNTAISISDSIKEVTENYENFSIQSKKVFSKKFNLNNTIQSYDDYYSLVIDSKK
jgi:glycosyltransferase involved in cell wall biosynthesis